MTPITLRGLCKRFGKTMAVDQVDLDIEAGTLFFLLGPSGCGKTTLLRMIAGFAEPHSGTIIFGEREVTQVPANMRNCGMVFQNYALWPHMTVRQNVTFGLDVRRLPSADKTRRSDEALDTVQMLDYAERKPNELSGGQQQRVALARALVIKPTVLLLDEPLSNLDAKLRLDMRSQIKHICKHAGITAVYVTHDQKEALSMADRLAVLNQGRVVQVGEPRELYHQPRDRFVADFLGETNFLSSEIVGREQDQVLLDCPVGRLTSSVLRPDLPATGNVTCSIRPEAVQLIRGDRTGDPNCFRARCISTTYLGEMAQHEMIIADKITVKVFELNPPAQSEDNVHVSIHPADVVILQD